MSCDQVQHVEAFYDGEMSSADRDAFAPHLASCADCMAELYALQRLSRHVKSVSIPSVSKDVFARFHGALNVAEERGVLRLAEWLTVAAAAVLVIGLTGLFRHDTTHTASAPDVWEQAAIAYPADHDPTVQSDVLQLTEWMRTDLSPSHKRSSR
jgi:anti-sigma factor RsiW